MNALGPVIAAVVVTGTFYVITRIRARRAMAADAYREQTGQRIAAAPWRPHLSVVADPDGIYTYTAPRPEQRKGGGPDEAQLGLVTPRSLAGGKGASSGLPHKAIRNRCSCGEVDGHTGQCFVVSYTNPAGRTTS